MLTPPIATPLIAPDHDVERLLRILDWHDYAATAVQAALRRFSAGAALLITTDQHGQPTLAAAQAQLSSSVPLSPRLPGLLAELAYQTPDRVVAGQSARLAHGALRRILREVDVRSVAGLALLDADHQPIGALWLLWEHADDTLNERTRDLGCFGFYCAIGLANAMRFRTTAQEADQLRGLLDLMSDALIVVDRQSQVVVRMNRAANQLYGTATATAQALPLTQILQFQSGGRDNCHYASGSDASYAHFICQDGRQVPVLVYATRSDGNMPIIIYTIRNITEQWQPLRRLIMAEKQAAMSRLAAIIAHEMNNPLQAIAGSIQILSHPLTPEKRESYLAMTREELDRLITLVRRTLSIHQSSTQGFRPVLVHPLLESVLGQLQPVAAEHHIQIETRFAGLAPIVNGMSSQLRELFMSLAHNAIEAIGQAGRLTVRTMVDPAEGADNQHVLVEFEDTGPGIPAAHLESMFEPFFTSRVGHLGMGLTISYSIVEHHGGHVTVASADTGTIFRVSLPLLTIPTDELA